MSNIKVFNEYNYQTGTIVRERIMNVDQIVEIQYKEELEGWWIIFSTIVPTSPMESDLKTVATIYLNSRLYQNDSLNSSQYWTLKTIANKCPAKGGRVVYQARALLAMYEPLAYYDDNCSGGDGNRLLSHETSETKSMGLTIYPNPNTGNFSMSYNLDKGQTGKVYILSDLGQIIGEYSLNGQSGKMTINNPQLSNGIYFYKLVTNGNLTKVGKIVIIK